MLLLLTTTASSVGQLITVLLIFVFVLVITAFTTKWIGNYQNEKALGENIVVLETKRISQNKIMEIVRVGDKYFAIALGKDEVTLIGEISEDSLKFPEVSKEAFSFKEFLNKAKENGDDQVK